MKWSVLLLGLLGLGAEAQPQCWVGGSGTSYALKSNNPSCLDNSLIPRDATYLDLSNIMIPSIPEGLFQGLANLQVVRLQGNFLKSIPEGLFRGLTNLQGINLQNNFFKTVPEGLFQGLSSLQEMYCSDCLL